MSLNTWSEEYKERIEILNFSRALLRHCKRLHGDFDYNDDSSGILSKYFDFIYQNKVRKKLNKISNHAKNLNLQIQIIHEQESKRISLSIVTSLEGMGTRKRDQNQFSLELFPKQTITRHLSRQIFHFSSVIMIMTKNWVSQCASRR